MKTILNTLALLLVALCAGCGTGRLQRLDISEAGKAQVHKIAILQVPLSPRITVQNSNVGMKMLGGGLIPGMIEQNAIQAKSTSYMDALKQRNITFGPELVAALKAGLTKGGYEVDYLDSQLIPVWSDDQPDIKSVKTDADTILHVAWGLCGYLSPDFDSSYTPLVNFAITLVNVKTQKTIYLRQFSGSILATPLQTKPGSANQPQNIEFVPNSTVLTSMPAPGYRYPSFEDLMAKFDTSVEGIKATQLLVAEQVAKQLAK
jgi:hypothetical protein